MKLFIGICQAYFSLFLVTLPKVKCHQDAKPCDFNSICTCKWSEHISTVENSHEHMALLNNVACLNVPLAKLPEMPHGWVDQVDIVGAELQVVDKEPLAKSAIESLRLTSNKIVKIDEDAFRSAGRTALASLDLSNNELDVVPLASLTGLQNLRWLNLYGNEIRTVNGNWSELRRTLDTLNLGRNDIVEINSSPIGNNLEPTDLSQIESMSTLYINENKLTKLNSDSLPKHIKTLEMSYNLFSELPLELLVATASTSSSSIRNDGGGEIRGNGTSLHLRQLYLRGNQIRELPSEHLDAFHNITVLTLEKLDIGENGLKYLPTKCLFNNDNSLSLRVRDLSLDFNKIQHLPQEAFSSTRVQRLLLGNNRLQTVHPNAFVGVEESLIYLDLEHNQIGHVPSALSQLKVLKYLYLSSNSIAHVNQDAFTNLCNTLKVLSFSENFLLTIPHQALTKCRLQHLNIGYNLIVEIEKEHFQNWGKSLTTLILRNNRIKYLKNNVFKYLDNLRELSLSYNNVLYWHPNAFEDVGDTLLSLEMSFSLKNENFPNLLMAPLNNLIWLALDNNNIHYLYETSLATFHNLRYLNLEHNKIKWIRSAFYPSIHKNLADVRLSHNDMQVIESRTFSSLKNLHYLTISNNKIRIIRTNSFHNLHYLHTLILSYNDIDEIETNAFSNLPSLSYIDLRYNQLTKLSLHYFKNVSNSQNPMSVNLSNNKLNSAWIFEEQIYIKSIDLSRNNFETYPKVYIDKISEYLKTLRIDSNLIFELDSDAFDTLRKLEILSINDNNIFKINRYTFRGLNSLQMLDLSNNQIGRFHNEQFSYMKELRILNLKNNRLISLQNGIFRNTKIEKLDLSHNGLTTIPGAVLSDIGLTLRNLKLSHNNIEYIENSMFLWMPYLFNLDLSNNFIKIIPANTFSNLGHLLSLDLSFNTFLADYKEVFYYTPTLKRLNLCNVGLKHSPLLLLPNLIHLNLSSNAIENIVSLKTLSNLRELDLSNNSFVTVPTNALKQVKTLKTLHLSDNPIMEIDDSTFFGLPELQNLYIHGLYFLKTFENNSLSHLTVLTSLSISTSVQLQSYIKSAVMQVKSLRKLSIEVTSIELTDQLHGLVSSDIKHLEIWGNELTVINRKAFSRLDNRIELTIQIRDTQIDKLPRDLFTTFPKVSDFTIDLRNNMLTSISPNIFYLEASNWESIGTKLISGGLLLNNNPWICDCEMVWLGKWLRRWLRETVQAHTLNAFSSQTAHDQLVRDAVCAHRYKPGVRIPIIGLKPEHFTCHVDDGGGGQIAGRDNNVYRAADTTAGAQQQHTTRTPAAIMLLTIYVGYCLR